MGFRLWGHIRLAPGVRLNFPETMMWLSFGSLGTKYEYRINLHGNRIIDMRWIRLGVCAQFVHRLFGT